MLIEHVIITNGKTSKMENPDTFATFALLMFKIIRNNIRWKAVTSVETAFTFKLCMML